MEIFTIIILSLLGLSCLFFLPRFLVLIPSRHFALVERFGIYNRTLSSGPNLILWPVESLKSLNWVSPVKTIVGTMGTLDAQLDVRPIDCTTSDKVEATVDGTLFFSVKTPHIAVYDNEDALNHLYQVATQAFRNVVGSIEVAKLNGKDVFIGKSITSYINDVIEKHGLSCKSVIIQNVTLSQKVTESFGIVSKLAMQSKEHEYQLNEARNAAEMERIAIEASGLTPEQRIRMEMAKSMGKARILVIGGSGEGGTISAALFGEGK